MLQRRIHMRTRRRQARQHHRIRTLAVHDNPPTRLTHHRRHALPRRRKLTHLQQLIRQLRPLHLHIHRARRPRRKLVAQRLRTRDQRGLIGTRGLEHHSAIAPRLRNHRVAHRQQTQKRMHRTRQRIAPRQHVRQARPREPLLRRRRITHHVRKRGARDRGLPELHLVARQRARLVRKNVVNLAQILHEVRAPALRRRVVRLIVQVQVRVDQRRLLQLDHIHRHNQRNGN